MRNCIANEVESTQNNKQFQLYFDSKACKELYGGGDNSGYNGKPLQGSQEDMPKATQQVSSWFKNKSFCS